MRWPTLLFDLDGTLIDSIELILESYRHTMRVHRGESPPDELFLAGLGTPLRAQLRAFTDDAEELAAMIQTYRRWNIDNHDAMVRAYPGALETVTELRRRGYRMGIVTSKNLRGLLRGLTRCGLEGLFDSFVTADSMEKSKPDPEPVLHCIAELGGKPESTLFIGDSPHDIAAGRAAGTATAACLWGPFPRTALAAARPDHWLHSFADLRTLLT